MTPGHAYYPLLPADAGGTPDWTFFAAGAVLAGFEAGTPLEAVLALWRTASKPDASIESVVAAVPTRGPAAVASFAVVIMGDRTTVVVRGRGSVDLQTSSGLRRIDSRNMQPWYLAEFDGVLGVVLGSVDRPVDKPTDPGLPLSSGVVRTPWLAWSPGGGNPPAATAAPTRASARARGGLASLLSLQQQTPVTPSTSGGSEPAQSPVGAPAAVPAGASRGLRSAANAAIPPMPAAAPSAPPAERGDTADLDDTIRGLGTGRLAEQADRAADLAEASRASGGDISDTIVTARRRHRADVPPLTSWSPARIEFDPRFSGGADARAAGYYCFRIGDGQVYRLDTPVYIGRKPSSPRIVTGTLPRLIKVPSPAMEVSSTHLEVRQEGNSVVVTDMRSTNGTFVSQPGSAPVKLRQGESMVVAPGTLVDVGDGNVLEILPAR